MLARFTKVPLERKLVLDEARSTQEEKRMTNLTQQELLLKAQSQFESMLQAIKQHSQDQTRTDLVERDLFNQLLEMGHTTLSGFIAGAGDGDEGESVEVNGNELRRSDHPHRRIYHSIFGEIEIDRYVYAPGAKKKISYSPVDARLGLPRGEYSYVLEDWLEQFCVKEPFAEGVSALESILHLRASVRTAEVLNQRMAEHAEYFRLQQSPPQRPSKQYCRPCESKRYDFRQCI